MIAPVEELILNEAMASFFASTATRSCPEGSATSSENWILGRNGEPFIGDKMPLPASMAKPRIPPAAPLDEYKNLPVGSIVTPEGVVPAANGEPGNTVSAPVPLSTDHARRPLAAALVLAYKNLPEGWIAKPGRSAF